MQRIPQPSMFYGAMPGIFEKAKELRENMTDAEKKLWSRLKNNQLGERFKSQHPIYIFIVNFYCHKYKLVVEIDGGYHKTQVDYDEGRTSELERIGIRVIRFTNEEVMNDIDRVVEEIKQHVLLPPTP
ncbi:MAG: endonuclease domain-containing protein [Bacteroidales bacterium]